MDNLVAINELFQLPKVGDQIWGSKRARRSSGQGGGPPRSSMIDREVIEWADGGFGLKNRIPRGEALTKHK